MMSFKDQYSSDPHTICNFFSTYFQSVYEPSSLGPDWYPASEQDHANDVTVDSLYFSPALVRTHLKLLDAAKGPGPDGIPPSFFKNTAETICDPLHLIFNKCISTGQFPSVWKKANIVPVFKDGSRQDIENYRPISILNAVAKLFEKLVHLKLYPIIQHNLIPEQHGFVKHKSTITNLMIYTNFLFNNMDSRAQTDAIYTDFKKAFDRVDHELLLKKIAFNGIRGCLLRWFCSYISNRSQTVVINGHNSDTFMATSGVPQGSILGPLMFIMYINDIGKCFKNSNFLLYADDLKIFKTIKSVNDCIMLQDDLDRLSSYCDTNKLQLNISKCKFIIFSKNKTLIKFNYKLCLENLLKETFICDLGIILDNKLHLNLHIDKIVAKAFKMYNFVIRSGTDFKRPHTYLYLFNTLIRPQVEYGCVIWDPYYEKYVTSIEKVQRKYLRTVRYNCRLRPLSYNESLKEFKMIDLQSRRLLLQAMMLHGFIHNRYNCPEIINSLFYIVPRTVIRREVRAYPLFATTTSRTNAGQRAPLRRLVEIYNKNFLKIDIFHLSLQKFKNVIKCNLSLD